MTKWVREGYCCRCGDCCKGDPNSAEDTSHMPCPMLRRDANGLAGCVDHSKPGTYWSKGCHTWPTKPGHIEGLTRCTYWFREVTDAG